MTLSELIINYRDEHGLSQRQFAKMCGLTNTYINMVEGGVNPKTHVPITPSIPTLIKISRAMGMTLHELSNKTEDIHVLLSQYGDGEIDEEIIRLFNILTLSEKEKVISFVQGLLAGR